MVALDHSTVSGGAWLGETLTVWMQIMRDHKLRKRWVQKRNLLAVIQIKSHMHRSQEEAITMNVGGSPHSECQEQGTGFLYGTVQGTCCVGYADPHPETSHK